MLQWGRRVNTTESHFKKSNDLAHLALQWGRRVNTTESGWGLWWVDVALVASMGPSCEHDGELRCLCQRRLAVWRLQWGRRVNTTESEDSQVRSACYGSLQWGRRVNTTERPLG